METPPIDGFFDFLGISVIHCLNCHGYEYLDQLTDLLISVDLALESAKLIGNWTRGLIIFTNGDDMMAKRDEEYLVAKGINITDTLLQKIEDQGGYLRRIVLVDNTAEMLKALYVHALLHSIVCFQNVLAVY